jgi:hypothetical protein
VRVGQNPAAHAEDDGSVPAEEFGERGLVSPCGEGVHEVGVGRRVGRAGPETPHDTANGGSGHPTVPTGVSRKFTAGTVPAASFHHCLPTAAKVDDEKRRKWVLLTPEVSTSG